MIILARKLSWLLSWKGLLGEKMPQAVYFETRFGIHTFGMRYPIDVVIVDNHSFVGKIKENLLPNRIFVWYPLYHRVLELPKGTIAKKKIRVGIRLHIDYSPSVGETS